MWIPVYRPDKSKGCIQDLCATFHTSNPCLARKDYYKILNISRNSSPAEIKKAYYQLAKKYHPDTNKGDRASQEKFSEVAEAYEVMYLSVI